MDKLDKIDERLGRIEDKLDSHLVGSENRITALETSVDWIKGHINYTNLGILAIIGAIATYIFTRG